jgi:hypothetical protein
MKTKVLLLLFVGLLATTGSTCINDGFLVAVNLPIKVCLPITAGPNLVFGGTQVVKLADLIDPSYIGKLKNVRYYDVRVSTTGTYTGTVYVVGNIDGVEIVKTATSPALWSDLAVPQSLLAGSTKITFITAGLTQLMTKLNAFKTDPNVTITLSGNGTLSGQTPVPSGLSVCIEILAQVDAEVK